MDKFDYLSVSETFYSIQGEGPSMGVPSVFLRLKSCNLMCGGIGTEKDGKLHNGAAWRCDTIEVWLQGEKKRPWEVLSDDLILRLRRGAHLVITGGEPLLQEQALIKFLEWLTQSFNPYIEVETNGTILPLPALQRFVNQWNISPKLKTSGVEREKRYRPNVIRDMAKLNNPNFKFVVKYDSDWDEIEKDFFHFIMSPDHIWLMPAASTIEELLEVNKKAASIALRNQVNFCTRLQVEVWNQTTGV